MCVKLLKFSHSWILSSRKVFWALWKIPSHTNLPPPGPKDFLCGWSPWICIGSQLSCGKASLNTGAGRQAGSAHVDGLSLNSLDLMNNKVLSCMGSVAFRHKSQVCLVPPCLHLWKNSWDSHKAFLLPGLFVKPFCFCLCLPVHRFTRRVSGTSLFVF